MKHQAIGTLGGPATTVSPLAVVARVGTGVGLGTAGAMHLGWAAGSSWPASSEEELAAAVVGSAEMPPAQASFTVGVGLLLAAAAATGALGQGRVARAVPFITGAGLLTRSAVGGVAAARALRLPPPGPTFRRLDARAYRPLCAVLGVMALLTGARRGRPAGPGRSDAPSS